MVLRTVSEKGWVVNKNKEMLQKIFELQNSNPDAEIVFFVNNDTICDDFNSTVQEIESVKFDDLYVDGSGTHYCGEEDIRDTLSDAICCEVESWEIKNMIESMVDGRYKSVVKKAILVSLSA